MSAPEGLRNEVAAVLAEHGFAAGVCACGWSARPIAERFRDDWRPLREQHHTHLADALLASPALARVIQEVKAEPMSNDTAAPERVTLTAKERDALWLVEHAPIEATYAAVETILTARAYLKEEA